MWGIGMNNDIKLMLKIYKTTSVDWLGADIKNLNKITRHHIVKRENGGENSISNYALLTPESHELLNTIEINDKPTYDYLNYLFLTLNRSLNPPTGLYFKEVRDTLREYKKRNYQRKRK